ncbi:MAG: hypothetical protein E7463_07800 [Ruminococcaceae bacterium]|nr:hypothetical protein [Oscillospiraceae bacterium]
MSVITFQTRHLRYEIGPDGSNRAFTDLRTGRNRVLPGPCAAIVRDDHTEIPAVAAVCRDHLLIVTFADGTTADILAAEQNDYLTFTLKAVSREDFLAIAFVNITLDEQTDDFPGCLVGMTLSTRMQEHPGDNTILRAEAYPHIGLFSTRQSQNPAKAAVIGSPYQALRGIQRAVLDEVPDGELPKSRRGGPYSDLAAEDARRTYTLFTESVTMDNVEEVIAAMHRFGVSQINLHHYGHYVQGDFRCEEKPFPGGVADFKKVVDRFHEEGMLVGLQPYTFFLSPRSTYVSPVPHPDLDTIRDFTLSESIDASQTTLTVRESTEGVSAEEGYVLVNSPYLWIDDELIRFSAAADGTFTIVQRGAYDTVPTPHAAGSRVRQLKEYFNIPLAKVNSELFYEIARNTARFYNESGADMFYLDALDGSFVLDGEDYVWYHALDFIREMFAHLDRDPIFDCCYNPQYTGSWFVRSRYGAIDTPLNAHNRCQDAHVRYNETTAVRMGITPELGWINLYPMGADPEKAWQNEPMYASDLEYLCSKAYATDACLTFLENFYGLGNLPCSETYARILQSYDRFRKNHMPNSAVKAWLSGDDNAAVLKPDGLYQARHPYGFLERPDDGFRADNPFDPQTPAVRIEALCAASDYDHPDAVTLCELAEDAPVTSQSFRFSTPVDARGNRGLGVWCKGDGSGAIVCISLRNLAANKRKAGQHFIRVDFTGWRYFAFYEPQNSSLPAADWPVTDIEYKTYQDLQIFYGHYRVNLDYSAIDGVDITVQGSGNVYLRSPRLVPHVKPAWHNPTLHIGDSAITFRTSLQANTVLHFDGKTSTVTDRNGTVLETPAFSGTLTCPAGNSRVTLTHDGDDSPRARVTLSLTGERLQEND